ncbi:hypothetical protein [Streptomyces sp. NPDC048142]|uniref:hypothetical protein n=1 Tax=Streptomyces sp. NPDC048142 TaxID=3365501 RepID=UPI003718EFA4
MAGPYFDWFEDLAPERKLERQVLLVAGAHRDSRVESDTLRKILRREHTNPITKLVDTTWELQCRGLLRIAPEPDDANGGPCTYALTLAGSALAGEIREQALAYSDHWLKQRLYPQVEVIDNTEGKGTRTVSFQFHNLVNESGSRPFATWTRGEHYIRLWSAEGTFRDVIGWTPQQLVSTESVQELAGVWGPVGLRIHQHRIYPSAEA